MEHKGEEKRWREKEWKNTEEKGDKGYERRVGEKMEWNRAKERKVGGGEIEPDFNFKFGEIEVSV